MSINRYLKIAALPVFLIMMQSCYTAKKYVRPEVSEEAYFRSDQLPEDSVTMADVSWREMFTDTVLTNYIEQALKNNLDIRRALQRIISAEAFYAQGKAGWLPTVSGTGQVNYQVLSRNSQFGAFFDGSITQYQVSAQLTWEADIWGKIKSQKRAFEATYLQSVAAHQAVKTALIADVSSLYFRLLSLHEQKRVTEQSIENRRNSLETTRALKEAGYVNEVGVKQTEAQLYATQALLVDIDLEIRLLENSFSLLLGEGPQDIRTGEFSEDPMLRDLETGFPIQLLRNRPDVIAAEYGLVNAFELTNVAKSNFYPSLTLSASGGLQSLELDKLFSVNSLFASVIGGLTQPIFNGRQIRTQYEVAQSDHEIAYLDFKETLLVASREVSDALYSYRAAGDKIALKTQEYEANALATEYSQLLLNNGLINYLDLLSARQNALNSRLELIQAQYDRNNSVIELYRALGGGWR